MKQSRAMSLLESSFNVLIGFGISFIANLLVLPLFGYHVTISDSLAIGVIFTIISIARGYIVRRLFVNWRLG